MTHLGTVIRTLFIGFALVFGINTAALADDWEAIKLRGAVFAFVEQSWVQLARGDVVPDDRIVRTAPNGRVQFKRGNETIDLGPDTQIRIFDRDGEKFTIVQQHFGDVAIEAERREVQHFAVQTRYLAAVVKGTRFSVSADENTATVDVTRGQVEVRDVGRKVMTEVNRGQSASVGSAEVLNVSGSGPRAPIVSYTGNAVAADVEAVAVVQVNQDGSVTEVAPASALEDGSISTSVSETSASSSTVLGTPAVANTADTPAASVVASTPAATNTSSSSSSTTSTTSTTTSTDTGTPAVSNVADTPAASVVASTPAATNTPPAHSNAGGKNK